MFFEFPLKARVFVLFLLFLVAGASLFAIASCETVNVNQKLVDANNEVNKAFSAVLDAQKAGADVSGLLQQLDNAVSLVAKAENAYRSSGADSANAYADNAISIARSVAQVAGNGVNEASKAAANSFLSSIFVTAAGEAILLVSVFFLWKLLKRKHNRQFGQYLPQADSTMHRNKTILLAVILIGSLLLASPSIIGLIPSPGTEEFSEIHLLGSQHTLGSYPYEISQGENYDLYVGVGNHMTSMQYYTVYVKLLGSLDKVPLKATNSSSPLPPVYEIRFLLPVNGTAETMLTFSVSNLSSSGNQSQIGNIAFNNSTMTVNRVTSSNGTAVLRPYVLLFELWSFNPQLASLQYNNQFATLQLNVLG